MQTNRNVNTLLDTALASAEGFAIGYATGLTANAVQGLSDTDATNGSSVTTIDDLVTYLNNETNTITSALGTTVEASRAGGEETYYTVNYLTISGTAGAVATASSGGRLVATFGGNETATTQVLSWNFATAPNESAIASALVSLIDGTNLYNATSITTTADGRMNRFVVTRNVSETGYSTIDYSPLAVNPPAITFVLNGTAGAAGNLSTTVKLASDGFHTTFGTYSAFRDNSAAVRNLNTTGSTKAGSNVVDLYVSKSLKKGITVRLKNTGTVAFSSNVSLIFSGGISNTAIAAIGDASAAQTAATAGLLVDGTNMISSTLNSATNTTSNASTVYWVAGFGDISDGTPSTSDSTTTAITADRTSWLSS